MVDVKSIYLVTGSSGFIGSSICSRLLEFGCRVIGIDNMNDYYDVTLKNERLNLLKKYKNFVFYNSDIYNKEDILTIFKDHNPNYVLHMAAQAGVRYSIENPDIYISTNIIGTYNILEACRHYPVKHLLFASSSSVYGSNEKVPFEETDFVDNPVSLYAATKKSNELMAYTYSHLYHIPVTGLRFFTVYGPMGRPDMAYYKFLDLFFSNSEIHIYNNADEKNDMYRDFTYIDDIIEGVLKLIYYIPKNEPAYKIYNIGNNNPIKLNDFIRTLENCLSNTLNRTVEFKKVYESMKQGDVHKTYASTVLLEKEIGFKPTTPISEGLQKFTDWYVERRNKLL